MITKEDLQYSTWNAAYMAAWMGGEFQGEVISICMAESLQGWPETITALLISYTPMKNKKFKKNEETNISLEQ